MRKTQWIELYRTIRRTWMSFGCICVVATIGAIAFLALRLSADAQLLTADSYYKSLHFYDLKVMSPNGFSPEDLSALASMEGIGGVEGVFEADGLLSLSGEHQIIRTFSHSDQVNVSSLTSGRLPEAKDECAIDIHLFRNAELQIGDKIEVSVLLAGGTSALSSEALTVTGVFVNPYFTLLDSAGDRGMSDIGNGVVNSMLLLPEEAYDKAAFNDRVTTAYLFLSGVEDLSGFSNAYVSQLHEIQAHIASETADKGWTVSSRTDNGGYIIVSSAAASFRLLALAISAIFLIIAIIISFFSISRIAEEQRTIIGTQKALGFMPREIRMRFIAYILCSTAISLLVGIPLGSTVIQRWILGVWNRDLYVFQTLVLAHSAYPQITFAVILIAMETLAVIASLYSINRQPVVSLMRNISTVKGKRIFLERIRPLWRRLRAIEKIIIKNALFDRSRMLIIVLSAAGCMVLLVMGFQLKFSADNTLRKQYQEIMPFSWRVIADLHRNPDAVESLKAIAMDNPAISNLAVQENRVYLCNEKEGRFGQLLCFEGDDPKGFMNLLNVKTGRQMDIPQEGMLISEKIARQLELTPGDMAYLTDVTGRSRKISVAGIFQNYVGNFFVISDRQYKALYEQEPAMNALYLDLADNDSLPLASFSDVSGFVSCRAPVEYKASLERFSNKAGVYTILFNALATLLSISVLLNLAAINIRQRTPELAMLRINGYSAGSLRRFILGDAVLLMPLGAAVGLIIGYFTSSLMLASLESTFFILDRSMNTLTIISSCAIILLLTMAINWILIGRLYRLDLTCARDNEYEWGKNL